MINQDYFDLSQAVITEDNVQRIAELIALKALKTLCKFPQKAFTHLYNGLIRDVYYSYNPEHTFSDAYDLVQTLICFLWENLGKRMDTIISINKKGTPLDVKRTCFKLVNKQINRYAFIFKKSQTTDSIMDMEYDFPDEINETQDYSKADELLEKMNLNQGQKDVLDCFMNGMSYHATARHLSIATSTIYRRRIRIQMIYNSL